MPPHQRKPRRALREGREIVEPVCRSTPTAMLDVVPKSSAFGLVEAHFFSEKLGMDWTQLVRLPAAMTVDEQHRREVVGRLFALLTAKFEDGAELAVRGQDPARIDRVELASSIQGTGREIDAIADGLLLLLQSTEI